MTKLVDMGFTPDLRLGDEDVVSDLELVYGTENTSIGNRPSGSNGGHISGAS